MARKKLYVKVIETNRWKCEESVVVVTGIDESDYSIIEDVL